MTYNECSIVLQLLWVLNVGVFVRKGPSVKEGCSGTLVKGKRKTAEGVGQAEIGSVVLEKLLRPQSCETAG